METTGLSPGVIKIKAMVKAKWRMRIGRGREGEII
jgi:hypothetical protein